MSRKYALAPARRLAWDLDGTLAFKSDNGVLTALTAAEKRILNDETTDEVAPAANNMQKPLGFVWVFPATLDLKGFRLIDNRRDLWGRPITVSYSLDTTTGSDGTWTDVAIPASAMTTETATVPACRGNIAPLNLLGIKGFRAIGGYNSTYGWHITHCGLYGSTSADVVSDRLVPWDPSSDVPLSADKADVGDIEQRQSVLIPFRLKNPSTRTASGITLQLAALTDSSPSLLAVTALSVDGVTYHDSSSAVTLPDLAPGAVSAQIQVHVFPALSSPIAAIDPRVLVTVGSWV